MSFTELDFLQWLSQRAPKSPMLRCGIGDDMAILDPAAQSVLFSSDLLLDGVHFNCRTQRLDLIGRKALACCLSDCAAMAVRPIAATVSVAFPSGFSMDDARSLFEGIFTLAEEFRIAIAGGDTTTWGESLAVDVAILATPWERTQPVPRSGARAGDRLFVTGPLGGSLLGRHLGFTPRVSEAKALAKALGSRLHAMIDISDGLALDLWRLCQASGVGARLDEKMLEAVISDDAKRLAAQGESTPLEHALHDGEDFELLLAIDGGMEAYGGPIFEIGTIKESGFELRRAGGAVEALKNKGFIH
jgi:thiamine-monophosphate kinase